MLAYDDGCNGHEFCSNREPFWFDRMLLFVERFHWYGTRALGVVEKGWW